MSNLSMFNCNVVDVRAAGSKNPQTGLQDGGIYIPAHTSRDGKLVSGKWTGTFYVNNRDYTDAQGVTHKTDNDKIQIVAWNNRNSAAGKGLADIFAKNIAAGKEISCSLRLNTYRKRYVVEGVPQADHRGQPIMVDAISFVVEGKFKFGMDSAATIIREINSYNGHTDQPFLMRPQFWNVPGSADEQAWQALRAFRKAAFYNGEATYGYARVVIPEGATLTAVQPPVQQQPLVQQPLVQQPAAQMPLPQTPAVQVNPQVQAPLTTPVTGLAPTVAAQQPLVQQPLVQQPLVQQPAAQPLVQTPPAAGAPTPI